MKPDDFWALVEAAREESGDHMEARVDALTFGLGEEGELYGAPLAGGGTLRLVYQLVAGSTMVQLLPMPSLTSTLPLTADAEVTDTLTV